MGRVLINDDDVFDTLDYLISLGIPKAEYLAENLWVYAQQRSIFDTFVEYCKDVKETEGDRAVEGWNTFTIHLPDGCVFNMAYKGNTLRIRRVGWKPTEVLAPRKEAKENCTAVVYIKYDN